MCSPFNSTNKKEYSNKMCTFLKYLLRCTSQNYKLSVTSVASTSQVCMSAMLLISSIRKDSSLLGCDAVSMQACFLTFQINIVPSFSRTEESRVLQIYTSLLPRRLLSVSTLFIAHLITALIKAPTHQALPTPPPSGLPFLPSLHQPNHHTYILHLSPSIWCYP